MVRVLKLLISILYFSYKIFLEKVAWILLSHKTSSCTVLYYHEITTEHRQRFIEQLELIKKWTTPITADIRKIMDNNKRYAVVTFDDAYQNVYFNAIPELKARDIPATIFVPSDYVGKKPAWEHIQNEHEDNIMTIGQLQNLPGEFITIGSHTKSHSNLTLLNIADAKEELIGSKVALERLMGTTINLFSFPYGAYNERLAQLAIEVGYQRIFTIEPQMAFRSPEETVTGRVPVHPSDWKIEFLLKIFGAYAWLNYYNEFKKTISFFKKIFIL